MKTYILSHYNKPVAVIRNNQQSNVPLIKKIKAAIIEEVGAEPDGRFEISAESFGDYGETTKMYIKYVSDGQLITDDEFTLMRTVCY